MGTSKRGRLSRARIAVESRIASVLSREAVTAAEWRGHAMSLSFASLFGLGGLLALVSLLLGSDAERDDGVVLMVGLAALATSAALFACFDRVPGWVFHVVSMSGSVMIAIAIRHGGDASAVYVLFYAWVTFYAAYFFARRAALAHAGFAAVTFSTAAALRPNWLSPAYGVILFVVLASSIGLIFLLKWREELLGNDLLESQTRLEHAQRLEALGRLAGGVAHDFNNILTGIGGYAALLVGSLSPGDPRRADAEEIVRASDRAAELTRQMLAFSRRQVMEKVVIDLDVVVEELRPMLSRLLGGEVQVVASGSTEATLASVNRSQLEQVVVNLVVNARDAMPDGGTIAISTRGVTVGPADLVAGAVPGRYAELAVTDEGIGIAPELLGSIFEPFFTTKDIGEGTGLGLAMVHGIVTQGGGHVAVESEPGGGSTFRIRLPAVAATVGSDGEEAATLDAEIRATVLLVDDEAVVRSLVRRLLEREGCTVLEAEDGRGALALEREHPGRIDLLLSDVSMPQMNGFELAEEIRRLSPDTAVLFMSGYADLEPVRPGERVVVKPFAAAELLRAIREELPPAARVVTGAPT